MSKVQQELKALAENAWAHLIFDPGKTNRPNNEGVIQEQLQNAYIMGIENAAKLMSDRKDLHRTREKHYLEMGDTESAASASRIAGTYTKAQEFIAALANQAGGKREMEKHEYQHLQKEFMDNPHRAMLELIAIRLETMSNEPATAYKCMVQPFVGILTKALSTDPDPRENYAWHECMTAWVHWRWSEKNPKTFSQKQAEKMMALINMVNFGVLPPAILNPIDNESPTHEPR